MKFTWNERAVAGILVEPLPYEVEVEVRGYVAYVATNRIASGYYDPLASRSRRWRFILFDSASPRQGPFVGWWLNWRLNRWDNKRRRKILCENRRARRAQERAWLLQEKQVQRAQALQAEKDRRSAWSPKALPEARVVRGHGRGASRERP